MGVKFSAQERESQISQLCEGTIYSFSGWVDSYVNKKSKFYCTCEKHGDWSISFDNFVNGGKRCAECRKDNLSRSQRTRIEQREVQIKSRCLDYNYNFVGWVGEYKNAFSKFMCDCPVHGKWTTTVNHFLNHKTKCPQCAGTAHKDEEIRIQQIEIICKAEGYKFKGWLTEFNNKNSIFSCECEVHGVWQTSINNFVNNQTRCPGCAVGGFDCTQVSNVYALKSTCGKFLKIGVSNTLEQRVKTLSRVTPFKFSIFETITCKGQMALTLEKMFHNEFESAGFSGFDGATEWLKWTPEIQHWLRFLK